MRNTGDACSTSRLQPILYHMTMDYPSWYNKVSAPFRGEAAQTAVNALDRALVYVVAAIYLIALAWLALNGDPRFYRAAAVPALVFAAVSIARAIIDAPRPYELFDIDPIIRSRTSILIAHRLSTILAADEILVVRDGQIVERGQHKDLVCAGGVYQELYETQFSKALTGDLPAGSADDSSVVSELEQYIWGAHPGDEPAD